MSTSAAKDPAITVGDIQLTECPNGDCILALTDWRHVGKIQKPCVTDLIHVPKANRNAIAEFLKPESTNADLLMALTKLWALWQDVARSNPGFMSKLAIQDYENLNLATIEAPRALAKASKV